MKWLRRVLAASCKVFLLFCFVLVSSLLTSRRGTMFVDKGPRSRVSVSLRM